MIKGRIENNIEIFELIVRSFITNSLYWSTWNKTQLFRLTFHKIKVEQKELWGSLWLKRGFF